MTNLNTILKNLKSLNTMDKFITYQFLSQYYNVPLSAKMIEKKINALNERKEEADIDDSIFDSAIQLYQDIKKNKTSLFQRQLNRDLVYSPKIIHYSIKSPLYESKDKKTSLSWYSIMQKEISERKMNLTNGIKGVNTSNRKTITQSNKRPYTRGSISKDKKRLRLTTGSKINEHVRSNTIHSITNVLPAESDMPISQKLYHERCSSIDSEIKGKRNRNRNNPHFGPNPIIPLFCISSTRGDQERKQGYHGSNYNRNLTQVNTHTQTNANTNTHAHTRTMTHNYNNGDNAKESMYYKEITRELINPTKSFNIRKPHFSFDKTKGEFKSKLKIKLHKGTVKDYLENFILKKSQSKKKHLLLFLAPSK